MTNLWYNPTKCENCNKVQSGTPSFLQSLLFIFLLGLFVIPGVIYFFLAKPSRCKDCGVSFKNNNFEYLYYKESHCSSCNCKQGGEPIWWQRLVFILLSCIFLIPGLIYLFIVKPNACFKCGLDLSGNVANVQPSMDATNNQVNNANNSVSNNQQVTPGIAQVNSGQTLNAANNQTKTTQRVIPVNTGNPLVQVSNLTKKYKGRPQPAVNNISFNIYPGHFHAFIGANGAGKTTTIKSIIGAYSKSKYQGTIKINNFDNESVQAKMLIGYIPEEAKFPKKMNTRNYLIKMAMLSGKSISESKKIAENILRDTKLEAVANKCPNSFSSGQKKKVLLAQALINDPKILIMDEPAANLDPLAREDLFDTLISLQRQGRAIFLSSHILDEIAKYTTYVTILDGGKIVYDSPIDPHTDLNQLYRHYVRQGSVDSGIMK